MDENNTLPEKALKRCLHDLEQMVELTNDYGFDELQVQSLLTAIESLKAQGMPKCAGYTTAMGDAANEYHASFQFAHPLPVQWRWEEVYNRMIAAAENETNG